jgi:hypothetical protein
MNTDYRERMSQLDLEVMSLKNQVSAQAEKGLYLSPNYYQGSNSAWIKIRDMGPLTSEEMRECEKLSDRNIKKYHCDMTSYYEEMGGMQRPIESTFGWIASAASKLWENLKDMNK